MCIVGTRPELIRFYPVLFTLLKHPYVQLQFIHTGQHYSFNMDRIFFNQLHLPNPDLKLDVGLNTQAKQLSKIIDKMEQVIHRFKPEIVAVWGDTTSSLAATLATVKSDIPVAHIEAGYRSFDQRMAEETNRILIDHCADLLFPFCSVSQTNLCQERVSGKIVQVGNPLLDIFWEKAPHYPLTGILEQLEIRGRHILVTCHRAENVDNPEILARIVKDLVSLKDFLVIFPAHPRTVNNLKQYHLWSELYRSHIIIIEPVGYEEMLDLIQSSFLIVTDSGGLQVEAFFAKKPCITIRRSTEWVLTVTLGVNFLVDPETQSLLPVVESISNHYQQVLTGFRGNPYGTGQGSREVVEALLNFLQ
ncbi:MAG: UDP-N-acetylglucosamine 2-epimerase (non-hydrolyzing) [Anaerolineales bacterium]|nr:UDP-N-acetylglucosamine 2-epimerase (non-hydrolyzing) [Anaerolineales bacterium]